MELRLRSESVSRSATEFSDHLTERQNYLWLAHSKLRPASLGPELLVGELPLDIQGIALAFDGAGK